MASLIDTNRKEHFEQLQIKKRRADKINQCCFIVICAIPLEALLELIIAVFGSGSDKAGTLVYAILLTASVICAILGCAKRNFVLNIAAVILYLAGFLIGKEYQEAFVLMGLCLHLIPYGGAVYANFIEHQLRQEEGYPQFDLSLEEQALRDQLEQQTSSAALSRQKSAESAPAQSGKKPASSPPDMDDI